MKKAVILLVFSIITGSLFSQNAGTISVKKPSIAKDTVILKPQKRRKEIEVDIDFQYWKYSFINVSTSLSFKNSYFFKLDLKVLEDPSNRVWGTSVQLKYIFMRSARKGVMFLFGPTLYSYKNKSEIALTPQISNLGHFFIGYGYNLFVGKKDITTVNTNFLIVGIRTWF